MTITKADKANLFSVISESYNYFDMSLENVDMELLKAALDDVLDSETDVSVGTHLYLQTIRPVATEIHEDEDGNEITVGFSDLVLIAFSELKVAKKRFPPIFNSPDCPDKVGISMEALQDYLKSYRKWPKALTEIFWKHESLISRGDNLNIVELYNFLLCLKTIKDYCDPSIK